jgi:hypothetical protein
MNATIQKLATLILVLYIASLAFEELDRATSHSVPVRLLSCAAPLGGDVFKCKSEYEVVTRWEYRADYKTQSVFYAGPSGAGKFENCAVFDEQNWACKSAAGEIDRMSHGKIWRYDPDNPGDQAGTINELQITPFEDWVRWFHRFL